jgi:hypothetical protein
MAVVQPCEPTRWSPPIAEAQGAARLAAAGATSLTKVATETQIGLRIENEYGR